MSVLPRIGRTGPPRAHFLIRTVALAANGLARRDERAEGWDTTRLRPDTTAKASRCAAPSGAGSSRGDWFGFA
ncbi:hypothetical protein EQ718_06695 [Paracoccus versutus]|uniref:hypothetical protein n=1 Tax=Paracoccus versutus TaxID=34007 RepID=UPI00051CE029|nr:hypothetical protein [Paracoccus versutus]KGJ12290.1 hypothetical protein IT40_01895 [Paracoccus versutus]WEJ78586.1 hypothetical protein EQ718_06695 [Paracoccus versutus]